MDRIYGPIRGAGVQVRETEPERNIVPGELGSTVFIGVFERGAEQDITICPGRRPLDRKMGGILDPADFNAMSFASLECPLNAQHFWEHSEGAGLQVNLRVTPTTNDATNDDRPDKSSMYVWNREAVPKIIGTLTAKNGGRWAGQRDYYLGTITDVPAADFPSPNQVQFENVAAKTLKRDEFKNGIITFEEIPGKSYVVVSNTSAGLFTFAADVDVEADWAATGPHTDLNVTVVRDNYNYRDQEKYMSVHFKDGTIDPVGTFGITITVDGQTLLDYEILSMDTNSPYYWKDVINSDPNNDLVVVADTFTGNRLVASARPANRYGESKSITTGTMTIADPYITGMSSPVGNWVPGFAWVAWGAAVLPQRLRVELTDATLGAEQVTVTTDIGNRTYVVGGNLAVGLAVVTDPDIGNFTLTSGTGAPTLGDYFYVYIRSLFVDELAGGTINPDTSVAPAKIYSIISNTRTVISVSALEDLTNSGAVTGGEEYCVQWNERLTKGYDGYIAGMTSNDYELLIDPSTTPLKRLKEMNLGLVKFAFPGIAKPTAALTLQRKAMNVLAPAFNWQYRAELPDEYVDDQSILNWVNNSLGRSDLAVISVPTYMNIRDPLAVAGSEAREALVSTVGMQLGREALVARQYDGYHKAAAGVDVTLPLITSSSVLGRPDNPRRLNEELLNPAGLNALRWATGGNTIIVWGDRTLDNSTVFKWKHKREQLSHYENIILENFDWAIFEINDTTADADVLAAVHSFFIDEYRKRAIRGDTFVGGRNPAAIIKMDEENNTDAVRAQGNQVIEVSLRFADTVERLKFIIGAMGVVESS